MRTLLLILLTCCGLAVTSSCVEQPNVEQVEGQPKELVNSIGMKLVLIPKGTFTRENSPVTLSRDYYMGIYEVTQAQYEKVIGTNPSGFKDAQNPVERVSWHDAVEFCKRLSELSEEKAAGRVYRLPTEAEGEYACRAGSTTKYSFGDDEEQLGDYAWFDGNSGGTTHPVGQKQPNAWGLYDTHGNVFEWCADWLALYPMEAVTDPVGPAEGVDRVCRGGSYGFEAAFCWSSSRMGSFPANRSHDYGFRLALSSPEIPQTAEPDK